MNFYCCGEKRLFVLPASFFTHVDRNLFIKCELYIFTYLTYRKKKFTVSNLRLIVDTKVPCICIWLRNYD